MAALRKQKKYNWKETNLALFGSELEKQVMESCERWIINVRSYFDVETQQLFNLSATHVYVVDSSHRSRRQVRKGRMHGRKLEQRQGSKSGGLFSSRYKVLVAGVVWVT